MGAELATSSAIAIASCSQLVIRTKLFLEGQLWEVSLQRVSHK